MLYRFGVTQQPRWAAAPGALPPRTISLLRLRLASEVYGDRILTTRGDQALYIKDARWVAPVADLLTQALTGQFEDRAPEIRLAPPRGAVGATHLLQVSLDRFEARYVPDGDRKAPPTIIVSGVAVLSDAVDRKAAGSHRFSAEEPAHANSTSAIVAAFDRAVMRWGADLTDWTVQASATSNHPRPAAPLIQSRDPRAAQ
ncbi:MULTISPECIES: ABC-type transport auxiliary lipoprotein family protein [Sphingomonas]|uniref:ABC-type transport auxiliary lipoprotein family protein n=1 Tax=Sphingomonas TaxID=13687 RepID=UPI0013DF4119|nr:ABC-type transport auxiliary lipoprotein family protein [Sphingomonas sp. ABOLF]